MKDIILKVKSNLKIIIYVLLDVEIFSIMLLTHPNMNSCSGPQCQATKAFFLHGTQVENEHAMLIVVTI